MKNIGRSKQVNISDFREMLTKVNRLSIVVSPVARPDPIAILRLWQLLMQIEPERLDGLKKEMRDLAREVCITVTNESFQRDLAEFGSQAMQETGKLAKQDLRHRLSFLASSISRN